MRFLGLIGARGGSKGIPRKNLCDLAGQPLISYTFQEAVKSKVLDRVVLTTDDEEIADLARSMGVDVPFMRSPELATDDAAMHDVILDALARLEEQNYTPDAVLLLQPTSPMREAVHIDEAAALYESERADSVISVSHPQEHPWDMITLEDGKLEFALDKYTELTNRQTYKEFYYINGAIYITSLQLFRQNKNFWGGRVVPYHMDTIDSIDVDSPADLTIAECLLQMRKSKRY